MKKTIAILALMLAAYVAPIANAGSGAVTLRIDGGPEDDRFAIALSPDGQSYTIESNVPLGVGGGICTYPEEGKFVLLCEAAPIGGFEVNGGDGSDKVVVSSRVPAPSTLRGGPGADFLSSGKASDKLMGQGGNDNLLGGGGGDMISGGAGNDILHGNAGRDTLTGGAGNDNLFGGPGVDRLSGGPGANVFHEAAHDVIRP
jgi:Ca2+-binding RTX toxin-like protein